MEKEKQHVDGFSPELAVVTHGGGQELEEPLVVRPTSETVIGYMYAKWINSYRDLPLLINQWGSVVRWEMRTKLFLRTSEFYWQEGHTAHATHDEAEEETLQMLGVYADFAINEAAVPVIKGRKSESEKFAGALRSYTIEAMMGDKRALQSGTSHNLGQNFAKAFDIQFLDQNNTRQYCWTTSWGLSTRFVGAIIMTHGDDNGLVLPPKLAPFQVVIVPIFRNDSEKNQVMPTVETIRTKLLDSGVRLKVDYREEVTPGFKFNHWELRGVPLRIEIGPRDIKKNTVALSRRDIPGKAGKSIVPQEGLSAAIHSILDDIQKGILKKATIFRDENIHDGEDINELKEIIQKGWAFSWWCGSQACETGIRNKTKSTNRCMPINQPIDEGNCVFCDKPTQIRVYFARAY
jgi:prolyl-tRNA synthetase